MDKTDFCSHSTVNNDDNNLQWSWTFGGTGTHCINQKSSAENETEPCYFPLFANLYFLLVRAVTSPMGGTIKCSSFLGMEDGREYPIAAIACRELTCYKLEPSPKAMDWLYLLFIIVLVALTTVMRMTMMMMVMMRAMMMKQRSQKMWRHPNTFRFHASVQTLLFLPVSNSSGSTLHLSLSAFVPLTPQWCQHWVYSFKWAFAHSLRHNRISAGWVA